MNKLDVNVLGYFTDYLLKNLIIYCILMGIKQSIEKEQIIREPTHPFIKKTVEGRYEAYIKYNEFPYTEDRYYIFVGPPYITLIGTYDTLEEAETKWGIVIKLIANQKLRQMVILLENNGFPTAYTKKRIKPELENSFF